MEQFVGRVHQAAERKSRDWVGLIWKTVLNNSFFALLLSEGDQRVELRYGGCEPVCSVFYTSSKLMYIVQEFMRQLITMSDTCGCANLPSGGGGGQALSLQYKHKCTEAHILTPTFWLFFAALREKKLQTVFGIVLRWLKITKLYCKV